MKKNHHSKYKNTGVLFELLVRQITLDTLSNRDSKAVDILKKFFNKTELVKEYKLYQTLSNHKQISEAKAEMLINTLLNLSTRLNSNSLKKEKYELIKEIKNHYNLEEFFKNKIGNYKEYASLYNLIEENKEPNISPERIYNNKHTLLEYLTNSDIDLENIKDQTLDEYLSLDKGSRVLVYKKMLEKFNSKYSSLNNNQKVVLKEYITNSSNTVILCEYVNKEYKNIHSKLSYINNIIKDTTIKIKLNEVLKLINTNIKQVSDNDLTNMLYYYELIDELEKI